MEQYEAWKDEEFIWSKTEILLPKNIKFYSYPVFWAIFRFYQHFHCTIYVWRSCGPNLSFFMVIFISLPFQIKKFKFQKFCLHVFVALKSQSFKILLLVWTLTPNKFWAKCFRCLIFAQTIVFCQYFMKTTNLISIYWN